MENEFFQFFETLDNTQVFQQNLKSNSVYAETSDFFLRQENNSLSTTIFDFDTLQGIPTPLLLETTPQTPTLVFSNSTELPTTTLPHRQSLSTIKDCTFPTEICRETQKEETEICSKTTQQIAKDIKLIAKENFQIRQLPQPQMHGVAKVLRNEEERKLLAKCDIASIEKKVFLLVKRKEGAENLPPLETTQQLKKKAKKQQDKQELLDLKDEELIRLLALRSNADQFWNALPIQLKSDIDIIRKSMTEIKKYIENHQENLIAPLIMGLLPEQKSIVTHRFVSLFFKETGILQDFVLAQPDFISMIDSIFELQTNLNKAENQVYFKSFPASHCSPISLQDRILWLVAVLSKKDLCCENAMASLQVLSLARYSNQIFKFAFRLLLVVKENEFLKNLLILASNNCLETLVYYVCHCEETKKNSIENIAVNLCQKKTLLTETKSFLQMKSDCWMRHCLIYFYRKNDLQVEFLQKMCNTTVHDSLLNVADFLCNEKNTLHYIGFLEALLDDSMYEILSTISQKYHFKIVRDIFVSCFDFKIQDYAQFYSKLTKSSKILEIAPIAFNLPTLHVQLPAIIRRKDSCAFFVNETPMNNRIDLMHMLTEPAQVFTTKTEELFVKDLEIFACFYDDTEKRLQKPTWISLSSVGCKSVGEIIFFKVAKIDREIDLNAKKVDYISPVEFSQQNNIAFLNQKVASKYVTVENLDLLSENNLVKQFIDIDFLKNIVNRAFLAPPNVTANDFVEQYCRDRNFNLTITNY